jgi:hypothetical protein
MCVICLDRPRAVALMHGNSAHHCICRECAGTLGLNDGCPICRKQIDRFVEIFN